MVLVIPRLQSGALITPRLQSVILVTPRIQSVVLQYLYTKATECSTCNS